MNIRYASFFSGCGAPEQSMKNLGVDFELMFYSEFDPQEKTQYASKSYSLLHNVDESMNKGDINLINEFDLPDFDFMTYGFPCQSFSMQGKRLGFDDPIKGNLFFETMRIAKQKRPKVMIAENVSGLMTHDNGNTFKTIIETLEFLGYNNYYEILNSVNFDLPHSRDRIFIVSIRKDIDNELFEMPRGGITDKTLKDIVELNKPRKTPKESLVKYFDSKYFTKLYNSKNNIIKLFDGCAEGLFTSSFTSNRIFSINGVSPTLTTKNDAVYYEINGHLTNRERFALQGFPMEYADVLQKNGIPKNKIDKLAGNSLPVNVFSAIMKKLLECNIIN